MRIPPAVQRYAAAGLCAVVYLSLCGLNSLAGGQGFRTEHLLQDHYDRYGHQFGTITRQQYLHLAQQLRDARPGRDILETKLPDHVVRFDRRRGYFGSYEFDGTIRTFFIPPEGIRYFEREAR